jgi:predicted RNase H-like HicB family nuclease
MYSKAAERFGDALLSIVETARANGATWDEIRESLESAIENTHEMEKEEKEGE